MKADVLITGGTGFLGRVLAKKLSRECIVVLGARDHSRNIAAEKETGCLAVPLDVASAGSVRDVFSEFKPRIVVHAAAAKFVDVSEKNPMDCVDVNILGSQNVIRASAEFGVDVLVGVSTDKAAAPDNIYGYSKSVMERMFHLMSGKSSTKMVCTRMGNIAWSTGSVLPIWREVCKHSVTIKATNARRFFFTASDASDVIIQASRNATDLDGKVLIPRMKAAAVCDLAAEWVGVHGGEWLPMDLRPGDKLQEDLISATEFSRTGNLTISGSPYFILDFSAREGGLDGPVTTLNSPTMTKEELRALVLADSW